jgi:hypothetical protein
MFRDKVLPTSPDKMGIAFATDVGHVWLLTPLSPNSYSPRMTKSEYLTFCNGSIEAAQAPVLRLPE